MKTVVKLFPVLVLFVVATSVAGQQSERERGIELYREGKFSEAIELLEKSVAANENDRSAWLYLGGAYVHTGRPDAAMKAFRRKPDTKLMVPPTTFDKTAKVISNPQARYSQEARRKRSSSTVRIAIELRADGTIGFVFPLETGLDDSLLRPAVEAAKGIRFEPAIKNGVPVTAINFVEYSFWAY